MFILCVQLSDCCNLHASPSRKWRNKSRGNTKSTGSTLGWCNSCHWSICCPITGNWWTCEENNEKLFLLCDGYHSWHWWMCKSFKLDWLDRSELFLQGAVMICCSLTEISVLQGKLTGHWSRTQGDSCLYFAVIICCCKQMCVLQGQIDGQVENTKEKMFVLCDDEMLLLIDVRSFQGTFTDRSKTEGETVCTLRWPSVAADGSPSFKDKFRDRSRTQGDNVSSLRWWSVDCWWISVLQGHFDGQVENRKTHFTVF